MILTLLLACTGKIDDTASSDTATEDQGAAAVVVTGEVTWSLTFDEAAQAKGFTDCSYTRTFQGTQYLDMDYLCPECSVQVQGTATMTEGLDCYSQISSSASTERTEHWGW